MYTPCCLSCCFCTCLPWFFVSCCVCCCCTYACFDLAWCTKFRWYSWPLACAEVHQLPLGLVEPRSHGHKVGQRLGFRIGRRFASGGGRGKCSAGRLCTGARCRFTSRKATRHRYQEGRRRCGHTLPLPGGSCYRIRVTWARIVHQAISGLDEGV